jgi:hypothetical protein
MSEDPRTTLTDGRQGWHMSIHLAKPEHEVAYQDIVALIRRHAEKLTPIEMLAVASNMLGKLVAYQDQRVTTPEMAMRVVAENIEHGNAQALAEVQHARGRA